MPYPAYCFLSDSARLPCGVMIRIGHKPRMSLRSIRATITAIGYDSIEAAMLQMGRVERGASLDRSRNLDAGIGGGAACGARSGLVADPGGILQGQDHRFRHRLSDRR